MSKLLPSAVLALVALSGAALSVGCGDAQGAAPPPATPATAAPSDSAASSAAPASPPPASPGAGW